MLSIGWNPHVSNRRVRKNAEGQDEGMRWGIRKKLRATCKSHILTQFSMRELGEAFGSFANLLKERMYSKTFTTEDSVRYLFFHTMTHNLEIFPNDILLESPHPNDDKKEVDMIVVPSETRPELVFEFKFHRYTGNTMPRPMNAGQLFKDIFRLAMYKNYSENSRCFVVYATDSTMANYFCKLRNNLDDLFNMDVDKSLHIDERYVKNHAKTFINCCGHVRDCKVSMRLKRDFDNLSIRIFEIEKTSAEN